MDYKEFELKVLYCISTVISDGINANKKVLKEQYHKGIPPEKVASAFMVKMSKLVIKALVK